MKFEAEPGMHLDSKYQMQIGLFLHFEEIWLKQMLVYPMVAPRAWNHHGVGGMAGSSGGLGKVIIVG